MYRHVLIGLDHSPAAARALAEAVALADREGGRLTILTAVPPVQGWPAGPVETLTAARQLEADLEREAVALQQRALDLVPRCLPVTTVLRHGAPCAALLARIEEGGHDVLVVGDDGGRRLRWRRSLVRRLERRSPVPVIVVRGLATLGCSSADTSATIRSRSATVGSIAARGGLPLR